MRRDRPAKLTRRQFLAAAGGAVLATMAGGTVNALAVEPRWVKLTYPTIRIRNLPPAWDGVRIAHVTDIHLGNLISMDYVNKIVAITNAASADLLVLTGDYVSQTKAINSSLTEALTKLHAPMGKLAVLGNHDHWTNAPAVEAMLAAAGITVLINSHRILDRHGEKLCIAGVDDLWEGRQLLGPALGGVAEDVPRILLSHNPDYAEQIPSHPRVDLMLSGHTHGGQVKIPFGPRPVLPIRYAKYAAGLVTGPHCQVYTSCGLGMIRIPVRFNCRPELPIITLRPA